MFVCVQIESPLEVALERKLVRQERPADEKALDALRVHFGGDEAQFKSEFQRVWLIEVMRAKRDMLVVARTGGGKSLGYLLPPVVEPEEVTVVIQPLKALVQETSQILRRGRVRHVVYDDEVLIGKNVRVVVATTDKASSVRFRCKMKELGVRRFVIDEAHCYEDDRKYREYARGVGALRTLNAQFVFMTGSMPPVQERMLWYHFGMVGTVATFREVTARPELQFVVVPFSEKKMKWEDWVVRKVDERMWGRLFDDDDRALIFIEDKKMVEEMYDWLVERHVGKAVFKHHSDLSDGERTEAAAGWRGTKHGVMVATSGFGAGIDYSAVRYVAILGLPKYGEVNKVYQEAGRAGRDGCPARVDLIAGKYGGMDDLQKDLLHTQKCITRTFSEIEDGLEGAVSCEDIGAMVVCGHCELRGVECGVLGKRKNRDEFIPDVEGRAGESAQSARPNAEWLPAMVNARQKEKRERVFGLVIASRRGQFDGVCGWCYAKTGEFKEHRLGECPEHRNLCYRCHGGRLILVNVSDVGTD